MMRLTTMFSLLIAALMLQMTGACWAQEDPLSFDGLANTSGQAAGSPGAPATDGSGGAGETQRNDSVSAPVVSAPKAEPSAQRPEISQPHEPFPPATPGPNYNPELARQGDGVSEVVSGITSGLGAWAGAWGACLASTATGLASAGAQLPLAATLGGSGVLGAAAGAAAQYALTGRVDWGSVAASTAGSMVGLAVAGPAGAVAGGMLASLAYGEGKKLLGDQK